MATQSSCITYEIGGQMKAPGAFNTFVFRAGVTQQVCWLLHPALPGCPRSFCSGKGEGWGRGGFDTCAMADAQAPAASRSSVPVLPPAQRRVWGQQEQGWEGRSCRDCDAFTWRLQHIPPHHPEVASTSSQMKQQQKGEQTSWRW